VLREGRGVVRRGRTQQGDYFSRSFTFYGNECGESCRPIRLSVFLSKQPVEVRQSESRMRREVPASGET
jgi:hypothetical protein